MTAYDEERLGELLRLLPPAPTGWTAAAKELRAAAGRARCPRGSSRGGCRLAAGSRRRSRGCPAHRRDRRAPRRRRAPAQTHRRVSDAGAARTAGPRRVPRRARGARPVAVRRVGRGGRRRDGRGARDDGRASLDWHGRTPPVSRRRRAPCARACSRSRTRTRRRSAPSSRRCGSTTGRRSSATSRSERRSCAPPRCRLRIAEAGRRRRRACGADGGRRLAAPPRRRDRRRRPRRGVARGLRRISSRSTSPRCAATRIRPARRSSPTRPAQPARVPWASGAERCR